MHKKNAAFTLVEMLAVMAMIGMLISLLLPAVQVAREAARRTDCANNLMQLILAVNQYEQFHEVFPYGTIDAAGPIQSLPAGYHHNWLGRITPFIEERAVFDNLDYTVSIYHAKNNAVNTHIVSLLHCPSDPSWSTPGTVNVSSYAGCHHDTEAPIDVTNNGAFILNVALPHSEFLDGLSHTIFISEKVSWPGDLGWLSGTNATLRNAGGVALAAGMARGFNVTPLAPEVAAEADNTNGSAANQAQSPLSVGGFASWHPGGANCAFGDGGVRFMVASKAASLLANRKDGQLQPSLK